MFLLQSKLYQKYFMEIPGKFLTKVLKIVFSISHVYFNTTLNHVFLLFKSFVNLTNVLSTNFTSDL